MFPVLLMSFVVACAAFNPRALNEIRAQTFQFLYRLPQGVCRKAIAFSGGCCGREGAKREKREKHRRVGALTFHLSPFI